MIRLPYPKVQVESKVERRKFRIMNSFNIVLSTKFDPLLFDKKIDFTMLQCTIQDILAHQDLDSALEDEKPQGIKEVEWISI